MDALLARPEIQAIQIQPGANRPPCASPLWMPHARRIQDAGRRLIVYATQQQGREALMTTTLDGKIKARLAGQGGDIREPDWGPFQNK